MLKSTSQGPLELTSMLKSTSQGPLNLDVSSRGPCEVDFNIDALNFYLPEQVYSIEQGVSVTGEDLKLKINCVSQNSQCSFE